MSKYRRNGRWTIRVPNPDGSVVEKATGTKDAALATRYETMCAIMMERAADHVFLRAACAGRLKLRTLFVHWSAGTLEALRAEVVDTDLTAHLADWRAVLVTKYGEPKGKPGCSSHTVTQYTNQVGAFFSWAGGARLTNYTVEKASRWLHSRPVKTGRKRRYWAALRSFGAHLQSVGVIPATTEPLAGLKAPPAGKARDTHLTIEERDRLIQATAGVEFQAAEAMAHLGMELGAILRTKVRDIEWLPRPKDGIAARIRMRGTKNRFRDRVGVIETWAAPYLRAAVRGKMPDARVVPFGGSKVRKEHAAACEAIGLEGYRFHDARHTFAVLWWNRRAPAGVVGLQLGHKDGRTVETVYGRNDATLQQLEHWAAVVAQADEPATKGATSSTTQGL
jgi:integrase